MGEGKKSNRLLFIYNVNFYVLTTHAGSNSLLPYDVIIILAPTQNNE